MTWTTCKLAALFWGAPATLQNTTVLDAETLLQTDKFDQAVVSAWLDEREKEKILAAAGKTPVLQLTELTLAHKLLAQVESLLPTAAEGIAQP
jgi:hypothetical protein